jgi:predicted MFS family arabinose efflux permease
VGSAVGGVMITQGQMAQLHWAGLVGLLLAMGLSAWAQKLAQKLSQKGAEKSAA